MNPINIINKIKDELIKNSSQTILAAYKIAFNETDLVKLFQLRSLMLDQISAVMESTSKSNNIKQTFNEISLALAHPNMNDKITIITDRFTSAHISSIEQAFENSKFNQNFEEVEEISELNEKLKESIESEDISDEDKKIILEICSDVDIAKYEHNITGNSAIKKLHEVMLGKLLFYKDIVSTQNPKIVKNLSNLYEKIVKVNSKMNTITNVASKVDLVIDYIQKLS